MAALVLASASPARAALLERAGLVVRRDPAAIDEDAVKAACRGADAAACAAALAEAKARCVARRHPDAFVICADQMLVCGGRWFDKPRDVAEARAQLLSLRGRRHELVTASCVVRSESVLWRHVERPALAMRRFSDAFLDDYLVAAGPAVLGSVGAYQLEGLGAQLFARLEGDYFSILGLPLLPLLDFLRQEGAVPA